MMMVMMVMMVMMLCVLVVLDVAFRRRATLPLGFTLYRHVSDAVLAQLLPYSILEGVHLVSIRHD